MKYEKWLGIWLDNYVSVTAKSRTVKRYREIAENQINPHFGDDDTESLSTVELQKFISALLTGGNRRTGGGLSSSAVNSVITVLKSSLSVACDMGMIADNPADGVKRPKTVEKKISCFSATEQKRIEQVILSGDKDYMFGIVICLYAGLRIGELLALTWKDVDFVKGILSVSKTCYDGKDKDGNFGRITDEPKTVSSFREIPIPKQIVRLLKEMKRKSKTEFVISKGAKLPSVRAYQRYFSSLLSKLHIEHRGFHALRHTFATRAIESGMDVKTLSEILGHKSAAITLNRYAHSLFEHKKEMMNKLGKLLFASR